MRRQVVASKPFALKITVETVEQMHALIIS